MLLQPYSYTSPRHPTYTQFQYSQFCPRASYFPYMYQIAAAQPAQQRTATVGVNANVGVGVANTLSMQAGTVPGQAGVNQPPPMALGVPAVPSAVLQPTANPSAVSAAYGGANTIASIQPVTQTNSRKARSHALPIINPETNRSIFETPETGDKVSVSSIEMDEDSLSSNVIVQPS